MLQQLHNRLMNLLGVGKGRVDSDDKDIQTVQVSFNQVETKDSIPRVLEYGLQSTPPDGFTAIAAFFGGNKNDGVVIATSHPQFRPKGLQPGEVMLYDNQGQQVYLSKDGIIVKDKAGSIIQMNGDGTGTMTFAAGLTINSNVIVNGGIHATETIISDADIADNGGTGNNTMAKMREVYDSHNHGGVHAGSDNSSTPNQEM